MKDEIHSYATFSNIVCSLNEQQCSIFYDIMYRKQRNLNEPLSIFLTGGAGTWEMYTLMKVFFIFTSTFFLLDPSKQIVFKMAFM